MKVAILNDTHLGVRNDSQVFLDFQEKFFQEIFFPVLDQHEISTVIHLGDVVDRRKYINFHTLQRGRRMLFDPLVKTNRKLITLIGNHDIYYNNTNIINSLSLLLEGYTNVDIITKAKVMEFGGINVCMVPWICDENKKDSYQLIKHAKTDLCMGHFPITGFVMHAGQVAENGIDRNLFEKFDMVFSGHFHHKSSDGRIYYLGSQYEMTWADYNDQKGFHIFDFETRDLQFIPNPNRLYYRIVYNDQVNSYDSFDFQQYEKKFVKIIIEAKTNLANFDIFIEKLNLVGPYSVMIFENQIDINEGDGVDYNLTDSEDTLTFLKRYIDTVDLKGIALDKLKSEFVSVYKDALHVED